MSDPTRCERCREEFSSDALFCPMCGAPRARLDGDPMVGQVVADRYLLKQRLGHGGSGAIYLAEHVTLRRKVAVKILHDELSRDDMAVERFRREATTVGEIDNEHIVEVQDFGRTADGRLFLAMELLEGETLADALKREQRLPVAQVVDVLSQLGEALMEAHAMGYIHRDLRPRNVFLARRRGRVGFVKLLDFGLAKLVQPEGEAASTSLGMTFGDPHYMSPEQAQGNPVDRRADIYSLGVMAYEMLTGAPPFTGSKVFDVLTKHLEEEPVPPSRTRNDVPPWLDAIVLRMLAKQPDARFVTVYRLVEALRSGQATGAIMADDVARSSPAVVPAPPAPRPRGETAIVRRMPVEEVHAAVADAGESASGMSGAWYADGESIDDETGDGARAPRKRPKNGASSSWAEVAYDDSGGKKKLLLVGVAVAAVVAVMAAVLFWPKGGERDDAGQAQVATAPAKPDAGTPVVTKPPAPAAVADAAPATRPQPPAPATQPTRPPKPPRPDDDDGGGGTRIKPPPVVVSGGRPDAGPGPSRPPDENPSSNAVQADFYVKLGRQALNKGDIVGAATNFNKAREFDPRNADAIAGLGEVALQQGYYDEAVVHLEAAARLAPRSVRIHNLLGQAYLEAGKPQKAAATYKKVLQLDPDNETARKGLQQAASQGG